MVDPLPRQTGDVTFADIGFAAFDDIALAQLNRKRCIIPLRQHHAKIRLKRASTGKVYPGGLERIGGISKPGSVEERHRQSGQIGANFDHVACRSGNLGCQGDLATRDRVEKGRFSRIRRSKDCDLEPVADPLRDPIAFEFPGQRGNSCIDMAKDIRQNVDRYLLVGKIERRFDQRTRFDQAAAPILDAEGQFSREDALCLLALKLGLGFDEIRQTLDLRKVHPIVLERTPGEFAGKRRPRPGKSREEIEDGAHYRPAAVEMEFHAILPGETSASGEREDQPGIEDVTVPIAYSS